MFCKLIAKLAFVTSVIETLSLMNTENIPIAMLTNSSQHIRHRASNDKVKQPLRSRTDSDIQRAKPRSRYLGDENPASPTPSEFEGKGEDKDEDEGDVAGGRDGLVWHRRTDAHVQSDVEHADCHDDGGDEQCPAAADGVGDEKKENAGSDDLDELVVGVVDKLGLGTYLDDAVDTCGEEFVCITNDSKTPENFRGVVIDCLMSAKLVVLLYAVESLASPIPSYLGLVRGVRWHLHHTTPSTDSEWKKMMDLLALVPVICWQIMMKMVTRARLRFPGISHISFIRSQKPEPPTS